MRPPKILAIVAANYRYPQELSGAPPPFTPKVEARDDTEVPASFIDINISAGILICKRSGRVRIPCSR